MEALYQIVGSEHPFIWTRQAEAHELAEHLYLHPFWRGSVRPSLPVSMDGSSPPRDGLEESADKVYLPTGISPRLLVGLQGIVDGWVTTKG
jgi:hypothetical protein